MLLQRWVLRGKCEMVLSDSLFNSCKNRYLFTHRYRDSITMSSLLQLGPWLAVEIPDLVEKGIVTHKEKTSAAEK